MLYCSQAAVIISKPTASSTPYHRHWWPSLPVAGSPTAGVISSVRTLFNKHSWSPPYDTQPSESTGRRRGMLNTQCGLGSSSGTNDISIQHLACCYGKPSSRWVVSTQTGGLLLNITRFLSSIRYKTVGNEVSFGGLSSHTQHSHSHAPNCRLLPQQQNDLSI